MSLSRKTPLRADPEKTRAFIDRNRGSLSRGTGTLERKPLKRAAKKRRASIPKPVRARVMARSEGKCICGCGRKATHIGHALEVSRWPELELIEANMYGVHHDCHWAHHFTPNARIPMRHLPRCVFDLVNELGPKAEAEIERYYG